MYNSLRLTGDFSPARVTRVWEGDERCLAVLA